jgi:DNA-binding transcriptional regulator PaaX
MSPLEENSTKRQRRANVKRLILQSVAATGLLAVALVAPNVVDAIQRLGFLPKHRQGEYIAAARRKLKKEGLLVEEDGFLRLSPKGERALCALSPQMLLRKPRKWDGKWRVLIFDIPERRRRSRDTIRMRLRASGFLRAQDSVWIYPYPCEEFVALLKAECRVGKDMLYLIVDTLEGDIDFRRKFGLPESNAAPAIRVTGTAGKILDSFLPEKTTINYRGRRN